MGEGLKTVEYVREECTERANVIIPEGETERK